MRKTPATENRPTHRMDTPCGTTTDVTVERLLISIDRGKEVAGDTDVGVGGYTGRTNQNGAEKTSFVFVGLEGGEIIVRGKNGKSGKRMHRRSQRLVGLINGDLDRRRKERMW